MANLKYFNTTSGLWEEIKVSTKFKDLYNTTILSQDQNYANIGITNFNPNEDVLFSIWNSTWLQKDIDYTLNGGLLRIESKDGSNWKSGSTFNFVALKNVDKDALQSADGSLIQDGSITIAKLATSIQTYINKIGVTALTTTAVTLSDAINELNTLLSDMLQQILLRPKMTTTNITYYVSPTGSDTNDGLTSITAFKTIQHAIDILPKMLNHAVVINVSDGTYAEVLTITGFPFGSGSLIVKGNQTTPANCLLKNTLIYNSGIPITIEGFSDYVTVPKFIQVANCQEVSIVNIKATVAGGDGIRIQYSNVYILNSTVSNKNEAIYGMVMCNIVSDTNTGVNNAYALDSTRGSVITKCGSTQPAGTTAEITANGGVIK